MDVQSLPKGAGAAEVSGSGRTANRPGYYKHPNGAVVLVMPDAKSTGQQDALVRLGYVWFSEPPTRLELNEIQRKQAEKDAASDAANASSGTFGAYNADAKRYNLTSVNVGEGSDNMSTDVNGTAPAQSDPTPAVAVVAAPAAPAEPTPPAETPAEPVTPVVAEAPVAPAADESAPVAPVAPVASK
jgi:hypothetical protein